MMKMNNTEFYFGPNPTVGFSGRGGRQSLKKIIERTQEGSPPQLSLNNKKLDYATDEGVYINIFRVRN